MPLVANGSLSDKGLCVVSVVLRAPYGVEAHSSVVQALIDSGSSSSALREARAVTLNFPMDGIGVFCDAFGRQRECMATSCDLVFFCSDASVPATHTTSLSLSPQIPVVPGEFEHGCDLIIGADLLDGLILTINYGVRRFVLETRTAT